MSYNYIISKQNYITNRVIAVDVADYYIVQEYTSLNSKKKYFRISTDAGNKFQEWIEIAQNN